MRFSRVGCVGVALGAAALLSTASSALAQDGVSAAPATAAPAAKDVRPFNPKDFSGVWRGVLYGYGETVPELTPEGKKRLDANKPSYGIAVDDPQARTATNVHIGRRRAVPPAVNNDPVGRCNPLGLVRLLVYRPSPFEVIQVQNRLLQMFEWTWDHREIWTDGRKLPNVDDYLPRWNGYSVGRWEGDTFVVETVGLDERQWLDHFGYPLSSKAKLQERWRRVDASTLEIQMVLEDPTIYKTPYRSDRSLYKLVEGEVAPNVWNALVEDKCVPLDNDPFYATAVKAAAGL